MTSVFVIVEQPRLVRPPRLIQIKDRIQPDFCESCGSEHEVLFWTGYKMSCVPCAKGSAAARRLGLVSSGMSYKQFEEEFEARMHRLAERLKNLPNSGLKTSEDRLLMLKLIKEDGDPIEVAFTSRIPEDAEMARQTIAAQTASRRHIQRIRYARLHNKDNGSFKKSVRKK